jgi:hypothetical protein
MNDNLARTADFGAFVKRQQALSVSPEGERVDWAKEREDWLRRLRELYEQIESFLEQYARTGEITLTYREIELNEENIGSYRARQMILKIGRQEITMTPVGTLLIGAKGRVEIAGPAGRTRLLLVDSEASGPVPRLTVRIGRKPDRPPEEAEPRRIKWTWKIATSPPSIQYVELTQESLFQALMEVVNG